MFLRVQNAQFKTAREEGLEEGQVNEKIAIAKKLFASGQTKEFISSIT